MGVYSEQLSQAMAVVGYSPPVGTGTSEVLTAAVDLSKAKRFVAYVLGGTLGTAADLTIAVKGSATSGGSYTAISGLTVHLVKATDDNLIQVIEFSAEQVQALGLGYAFAKVSVTPSVASQWAALVLSGDAYHEPNSASNTTAVKATTVR